MRRQIGRPAISQFELKKEREFLYASFGMHGGV
jgi:hypothetical protein